MPTLKALSEVYEKNKRFSDAIDKYEQIVAISPKDIAARGHENGWSNHQKGAREDLLTATKTFHKAGFKVAVIIDPYAPNYIKVHPELAAVKFNGEKSPEQIGFIETVEGNYGKLLLEMIEYISKNYPVDIINLTELSYYHYSYNDKDLRSYEEFSGRKGWPRNLRGEVEKDDPSIPR